jgi:hypothetical protein
MCKNPLKTRPSYTKLIEIIIKKDIYKYDNDNKKHSFIIILLTLKLIEIIKKKIFTSSNH